MNIFQLCGEIIINGADAAKNTLKNVSNFAENVGTKLQSAGKHIEDFGKKFSVISGAAATILGVSAKSAAGFEDAMAKVSTIADTSQVPLEQLRAEIMKLSNESGLAASDIADNVYNAISAGQQTGDAVNFVSNATTLARAGFTDSASALDVLTTIMNAYGLEASEVTAVSDKLITTQNLGKTTVAELATSMGKVIPTAKSTGVNLDQLCGAYAVMTSNGIATAETTTYLNSMLNELGKEGTTAADAFRKGTEHIKKGGLSMAEAMESGMSLTDVLGILDEQAQASGTSINNLFGSAEAGKAAAVLWDNADKVTSSVAAMGDSVNATQEAYDKLNTTSFSVSKTLNTLKNTGIELGTTILEMLSPAIEKVSSVVSALSDWFHGLDDGQKKSVVSIIALVAAVTPACLILKQVLSVVGSLSTAFSFLCSPVGLVIAAIAALIAIFVNLYNTNEEFRAVVDAAWSAIQEKIGAVISALQEFISAFVGFAKGIWQRWGDDITNVATKAFSLVSSNIQSALDVIKGIIKTATAILKGDWSGAWDALKGTVSSVWDGIKNTVSKGVDLLKSIMKFDWSLPKIKLPHFSISGSFSLNPPSIPHFSVSWYKKAMDNPLMFTKPTIFGVNGKGQPMGAGDAGDEVMIGKETMLNMIRQAVADESSSYLGQILALLQRFFPEILAIMERPLKWDDAVVARKLAPAMDTELGLIMMKKGRGR